MHHLAQLNIARMKAPVADPSMQGFTSQIPAINALAESSPGFIWRLQDEYGDATSIRAFDDPLMLVNLSVWESVDALREFVYRSAHRGLLRDRAQWVDPLDGPHLVMWWIPAGHIPTVDEAKARLEFLRAHGDSDHAFSIAGVRPPPQAAVPATTGD